MAYLGVKWQRAKRRGKGHKGRGVGQRRGGSETVRSNAALNIHNPKMSDKWRGRHCRVSGPREALQG
eukprot:4855645-Pyramimonas_sp.AAC.1